MSYSLEDFRVHEVEPSTPTAIPQGKVVIVVDVGDSVLAPHQTTTDPPTYYYRAAGHSRIAPHFYLETLRNRLVNPTLEPKLTRVQFGNTQRQCNEWLFVELRLSFEVYNVGRVAAYKWALVIEQLSGIDGNRSDDYKFTTSEFPASGGRPSSIRLDSTILPSLSLDESRDLGLYLRPRTWGHAEIREEFERMLPLTCRLHYRAVSETSRGDTKETVLGDACDYEDVITRILQRI